MSLLDIENQVKSKKLTKKWRELSLTLYFLSKSLKPGFLWDIGSVSTEKLLKLSFMLEELLVIIIEQDYYVCSKKALAKHLDCLLDELPIIIDVSGDKTVPEILQDRKLSDIHNMIKNVKGQVEELQESVLVLQIQETWNISTLFGLLLGYPIVYYYNSGCTQNCLNNTNILVFRVGYQDVWPISFTVPAELYEQCRASIDNWKSKIEEKFLEIDINIEVRCENACPAVVTL